MAIRPRTQEVVSIVDELLKQSNRDQTFTPRSPVPFPSDRPFDQQRGSSMRTFSKALDMSNVAGAPTPLNPRSLASQREPYRPAVNLGETSPGVPTATLNIPQVVERQQTPEEMALNMPRVPGSDMDMTAAVDEAEASMRDLGSKATQAALLEARDENLKTDPTFQDRIKGFFGDRGNMLRLALAFNSLRTTPDQGLATMLTNELKDLSARGRARESANKTVAALRQIGTKEALQAAAMIEANPSLAKEIYSEYAASELKKPGDQRKGETDIRKEFTGNAEVKDFGKQASAFGRVVSSSQDPSAAGDLALIFNFMKVLDPGSTVREGEFATAQNAAGVEGRLRSLYNNVLEGTRLNDTQREDFVNRARMLFQGAESGYQGIRDQYIDIAGQYGYDVDRAVPDLYQESSSLANPSISYDQVPPETKRRFPDEASWNQYFQGLPYLEQLKLMRAL